MVLFLPEVVTCPALSDPTNGMVDVPNNNFGTVATFTCDNGYTLTGGSFRVCQNDGTWSGSAPTCQGEFHYILTGSFTFLDTVNTGPTELPTTCPDLTVPANGMISYNMGTASLRPVDTVATYTCNTGYTLNGGGTRTCGSDGVWSRSAPTCQGKEYKI